MKILINELMLWKGDPYYAWTYMFISIIQVFTAGLFVDKFLIEGNIVNIWISVIIFSSIPFFYFCAIIEKKRIITNGRVDE